MMCSIGDFLGKVKVPDLMCLIASSLIRGMARVSNCNVFLLGVAVFFAAAFLGFFIPIFFFFLRAEVGFLAFFLGEMTFFFLPFFGFRGLDFALFVFWDFGMARSFESVENSVNN